MAARKTATKRGRTTTNSGRSGPAATLTSTQEFKYTGAQRASVTQIRRAAESLQAVSPEGAPDKLVERIERFGQALHRLADKLERSYRHGHVSTIREQKKAERSAARKQRDAARLKKLLEKQAKLQAAMAKLEGAD